MIRRTAALVVALVLTSTLHAQVKYPPRAEKLDIRIRYRIQADRDERILRFRTPAPPPTPPATGVRRG